MQTSLPPLPKDKPQGGVGPSTDDGSPQDSAFSGGLPGMMQAVQTVEMGLKDLAQRLPSLGSFAAETIAKLRMAIPNAIGAGASQGPTPGSPAVTGSQGLPQPPVEQGQ